MEVARRAVDGGVHVHRGDDDSVVKLQAAQPQRIEHGRTDLAVAVAARLLIGGEPLVNPGGELRVTHPQVVAGNPAAARHDVEGELRRLLTGVLADVLEPLQAGLRRPLGRGDDWPTLLLVGGERAVDGGMLVQAGGSARASSIASLVPDPMEKCAVWAASPSSTTFPALHRSFLTVVKLIHRELLTSSW